ncbi:unnamed protein product [Parnassius apollo]|uniref:(apollo) hypothetical protein n=1 Tax=Parnassius apollo TaxID=110799 RepID=A0A8S3XR45_PARAO|nr:unnamed protein product [Parnassius apollo]
MMNKEEERIMRLFEKASTGSSIPDPFSVSDDGQYGSDGDYNPCNDETHYDEYLDVTLTEDVPRSHDDSITSCESVQSESILQTNTTQPVEEQQEPDCSSNITMQDPEPGPNNISERHNRPITPPATVNWEHTTLDIPQFNFDSTSTGVQFHID